jgi:Amt family ammonium transporter
LSSSRTLTWLACIPIALLGLGLFNLSAHAAELPELTEVVWFFWTGPIVNL